MRPNIYMTHIERARCDAANRPMVAAALSASFAAQYAAEMEEATSPNAHYRSGFLRNIGPRTVPVRSTIVNRKAA